MLIRPRVPRDNASFSEQSTMVLSIRSPMEKGGYTAMESPEWTPVRSMCCMTPGMSTSTPSEITSTSSSLPIKYWSTSTGFSTFPERMTFI